MVTSGCESKSLKKMLCFIVFGLIFCLVISPVNALAMNTEYLGNGEYWANKGTAVNISEGTLNGCLKYEIDEENGCGYFYFYFIDSRANATKNDCVYLGFLIENEQNIYEFTVSKDGVDCDNANYNRYLDIKYDFSGLNTSNNGGEMYVAFQLKNRDDLTANNEITCNYSINLKDNIDILSRVYLDMTPTTVVNTTAKKPTETTIKQTTMYSTKASQPYSTKKEVEKTKFTPSTTAKKVTKIAKTKNSVSSTARKKFTANQAEAKVTTETTQEVLDEQEDFLSVAINEPSEQARIESKMAGKSCLSNQSKILIAFSAFACLVGVILIIIAIAKGKYKLVAVNENENNEE